MCVSLILSFIPLKTGSPISKLVLLKLADNADARGVCFPSLNYLAQYCEVSVRTVKRHLNELEKQGFVKRIKRFDNKGRQRSNLYQLRLPNGCHIEQSDLDRSDVDKAESEQPELNPSLPQSDHSDTHQGDSRSNTESDRPAHIIFHKEHKTDISLKSGMVNDADILDTPNGSEEHATSIPTTQKEAVINLLTKEGCAPIYHEFYEILKRTYPKLDVLQELHAMQAWLYINPDKRKPFEHIGHFVNGWLRRSAQAKTKRGLTPVLQQTKGAKQTQTVKQKRAVKPTDTNKPTADLHHAHSLQSDQVENKQQQPTPVSQALADYKAKSTTNPFEARIKALIQSKSTSTDPEQ
ncbi:helix-turn-helix domain-containing protein [Vibrio kanaloae]|uniref:helix-turn-helix domain-containing protein n=1 Tax=Vibrio kanaloae TaxID=170673 RepID=UPI0010BE051D|nr:helix-turn-helix domain-containing protein [Vibrio kanaloae]TKF03296.1 helix-turn-helix domain-containing protein [Vibrio kanaloae]TKF54467.1 helix-turn-helix domain-containing protein [Vibrio kanaloae]